jgi:hypothetical protein
VPEQCEGNGGGVHACLGERWWLLGQVVSILCDIDLCCPHKPQTHPADALMITTFPDQTIVGSYFDDEEAERRGG